MNRYALVAILAMGSLLLAGCVSAEAVNKEVSSSNSSKAQPDGSVVIEPLVYDDKNSTTTLIPLDKKIHSALVSITNEMAVSCYFLESGTDGHVDCNSPVPMEGEFRDKQMFQLGTQYFTTVVVRQTDGNDSHCIVATGAYSNGESDLWCYPVDRATKAGLR